MDSISFPDGPRSELEDRVAELVSRAQDVLRMQERLRHLLAAYRRIVEHLGLDDTLVATVRAAVDLVGARYGAIGVIDPGGEGLERFLQVGMDDDEVARLGHPPRGAGLLGAVTREDRPIRLRRIADDSRSVGLPAGHPPMEGFLGVPIHVRDVVFGNLYLTNPQHGEFTLEDQELVESLAATAGVAIANARLFEESRLRERWAAATADVTTALLSDEPLEDVLTVIADRVLAFIDADLVSVVVPLPDVAPTSESERVRVLVAVGPLRNGLTNDTFPIAATLAGNAMRAATVVTDQQHPEFRALAGVPPIGPSVAIPLRARGIALGALTISRSVGGSAFSRAEVEMADEFGRQTSVALAVSQGRQDRRRLERIDDRRRIARDLHDHVIQRLFAAGLSLQIAAEQAPENLRPRIESQVEAIDGAIVEIRTAVFALRTAEHPARPTTRDRILDAVAELSPALGHRPRITFVGPVDLVVTGELARDVVAVVRESVANVARHASGASCSVEVAVHDARVVVTVLDGGPGVGQSARHGGTANLASRAAARDGRYELADAPDGGTRVVWDVPRPVPAMEDR
ncbi:GAF domain-containing sensor histidine kinase [Curtobacterium ammoniigenes]|uniref:GAF domain-containing sensor histidine kinase n=1 Tax=Curtobacterium ammoniigenes TaxID=395387 RepID=UPI00082BBB06|nr:GAF domain-containing protein [Curtobacterium ammoniigenes]